MSTQILNFLKAFKDKLGKKGAITICNQRHHGVNLKKIQRGAYNPRQIINFSI